MTMSPNGPGYPDSYYVATAKGMVDRPALDADIAADVCVIGAGFTGLSAALNLAEQGMDVVLLEAERIGFGASGRCGGMIGSGQRKDVLEVEEAFGLERSKQLWTFAEQAKQEVRDRVAKHEIPCDLQDGQLIGVHKRGYLGWAQELADVLTERYAYPFCRALSAEETREYVATDDFLEGLYDPEAMTLHPLNYLLGVANAAGDAGVQIFENSRVESYSRTDPAVVRTAQGSVKASHIVLACNGYLGNLEPRSAGKIMPINNFMVATEPLGEERALELINGRFGLHDTRFVVNYFRLSDDYRLLYGGGENYRPGFPSDIAKFVRPYMIRMFPQLKDVAIDDAWGGTLAVTVNRLPHVGRLEPNVWFGQGYSGHGVNVTHLAGQIMADVVAGTFERFDMFANINPVMVPGAHMFSRQMAALGVLYYQIKDRL